MYELSKQVKCAVIFDQPRLSLHCSRTASQMWFFTYLHIPGDSLRDLFIPSGSLWRVHYGHPKKGTNSHNGQVPYIYLHLLTGHNFSLNRKISLFWFCQEFPPTGCFSFFRRKLLHVFLWMRTIVGRKDTVNGQKYPANGRKWPKSLLGRHCIKNQPRAEKNASGKKNTFGQLFCLKPFGLKLKPSRRSRYTYIFIWPRPFRRFFFESTPFFHHHFHESIIHLILEKTKLIRYQKPTKTRQIASFETLETLPPEVLVDRWKLGDGTEFWRFL